MILYVSLFAAVGLVLAHLFAGKLRFLEGTPRSRWLSIAGGVSVAYVFIHLLPELGESQEIVGRAVSEGLGFVEHHVYVVALAGLTIFYGLERLATHSRQRQHETGGEDTPGAGVFWLHIASFGIYNLLIGYLLIHRIGSGLKNLILFFIAMLLHFVVTDYGLREHHKHRYKQPGRWLLAGAVLLGWAIGLVTEISELAIAVLVAFLAGGVVLNFLKEELPEERESRFSAFLAGVVFYSAVLLAL